MGFQQVKLFYFRCVVKRDPPCATLQSSPACCGALAGLHLNDGEYPFSGKPPGLGIIRSRPFADIEVGDADLYKEKTELLFVALFIRLLRVGGRCACIVPDGVLFGSSKAHKNLRKELIENQYLEAVISMPSGVFKPYAGVSTAILIFTKTNGTGTDKVWFYDMKADGYSLDDKRQPVQENDIPDIIERFHKKENEEDRERTEQSFMVDKQEIIDNGYDLSINKYKKIEYVPVEYPPTEEILAEIEELNEEITKETAELRALLRK